MAARPNQDPGQRARSQTAGPSPDPDQETYYQLLNVAYTATAAEITRSYREAMKRYHPDRVRPEYRLAAENLSKDLNRAYKTLSDPVARLQYDKTIRNQEVQDQIMKRYVGGFAGADAGGFDPYSSNLKREVTEGEKKDHRRSERSAIVSLFSVFLVVTLGAIGLILIFGLVSFVARQVF